MMSLNEFNKGKQKLVCCTTQEQAQTFIDWATEQGYNVNETALRAYENYNKKTVLGLSKKDMIVISGETWDGIDKTYDVISFEEFNEEPEPITPTEVLPISLKKKLLKELIICSN